MHFATPSLQGQGVHQNVPFPATFSLKERFRKQKGSNTVSPPPPPTPSLNFSSRNSVNVCAYRLMRVPSILVLYHSCRRGHMAAEGA